MTSIFKYFKKSEDYNYVRFITEMSAIVISFLLLLNIVSSIFQIWGIDLLINFENKGESYIKNNNIFKSFLAISIISPFIESIIFQGFLITISKKIFKRESAAIITSALFFSLSHGYPGIFLFFTFVAGIILAWSFILHSKKGFILGILITSIIHGIVNTFSLFSIYFCYL